MNPRESLSAEEQVIADRLRQEWTAVEPPLALDQAILQRARAAVAPARSRRQPWLVGVASAAALVLTFGVIWRTMEAPPQDELYRAPAEAVMPAPSSIPPAPEPHESNKSASAPAEVLPSTEALDVGAGESARTEAVFMAPLSEAAPAPSADGQTQQHAQAPTNQDRSSPLDASATTVPPQDSSGTPAPRPFPAEPAPDQSRASEKMEPASTRNRRTHAAPTPQPAPAPPAAAPVTMDAQPIRAEEQESASQAPVEALNAGRATASQSSGDRERRGSFSFNRADFDDVVANIRRLLQENRRKEAVGALAELRERYPDVELPDDLIRFERAEAGRR